MISYGNLQWQIFLLCHLYCCCCIDITLTQWWFDAFDCDLFVVIHLISIWLCKTARFVFFLAAEYEILTYYRSLVVTGNIASFVWRICSHMHHFRVAFLVLHTLAHPGHFQSAVSAHLVRWSPATLNARLHERCFEMYSNQGDCFPKFGVYFISYRFLFFLWLLYLSVIICFVLCRIEDCRF